MLMTFVDEAGDRGIGRKSSPYFIMGAVTVEEATRVDLAKAVASIKERFTIPLTKPLHWTDHCRTFARRQFVARSFAAIPGVQVNYVIFKKTTIPAASGLGTDHRKFYNYAAGVLLDRVLLGATYWPGVASPSDRSSVTFVDSTTQKRLPTSNDTPPGTVSQTGRCSPLHRSSSPQRRTLVSKPPTSTSACFGMRSASTSSAATKSST